MKIRPEEAKMLHVDRQRKRERQTDSKADEGTGGRTYMTKVFSRFSKLCEFAQEPHVDTSVYLRV
jgi:hypothetical protein